MNNSFKKMFRGFEKELLDCETTECAILFLINKVNFAIKKAKYEQGHAILDYIRQKYIKREEKELSSRQKIKIFNLQLQRIILWMGQDNRGGTRLIIAVSENMQKKLGNDSRQLDDLKRIVENKNSHEILKQVAMDERFDLNNLNLTIKMLLEQTDLVSSTAESSSSQIEKLPVKTMDIKPYATSE